MLRTAKAPQLGASEVSALSRPRCKAAMYLRSTTYEQAALAKQKEAIEGYARQNDIEIVQTFAETGTPFAAQKEMLWAAMFKAVSFSVIHMEDVSRWERFQDAHDTFRREHLCKVFGIDVRYVQEETAATAQLLVTALIPKSFIQKVFCVFK